MKTDSFWVRVVSWFGAGVGLIGSYLIALNHLIPVAFCCYVVSGGAWVACSIARNDKANLLMQLGFIPPGFLGLYRVLG